MAAENETGFLIDGKLHEVPTLGSLDNDECMILFDYSQLVQEDFAPLEDETEEETEIRTERLMRHPGFWPGLMHIAYRRAHRDLKDAKIKGLIGRTNRIEALSTLAVDEPDEVDGNPPALTSRPDESSPKGLLVNGNLTEHSHESSGNGSTTDSVQQDATLGPIGITKSDTSSPASPPRTSAA